MGRDKQRKPKKAHWNVDPATGRPRGIYCPSCKTLKIAYHITEATPLSAAPHLCVTTLACAVCGAFLTAQIMPVGTMEGKKAEPIIIESIN